MTRKDFVFIATVIKSLGYDNGPLTTTQRALVARRFADALIETNPRFNDIRFINACTCMDPQEAKHV